MFAGRRDARILHAVHERDRVRADRRGIVTVAAAQRPDRRVLCVGPQRDDIEHRREVEVHAGRE